MNLLVKRKLPGNLMEKLNCNKMLNHLGNDEKCNSSSKCNLFNYHIESTDFFNEELKKRFACALYD